MGHATDASADRTPVAGDRGGRSRSGSTGPERSRPSSEELFDAVVELQSAGAASFKGTARRYSICTADAEDAYQRGLEILITKAPTSDRSELRPWLHTVIKHEALALRRQRERLLAAAPGSAAGGAAAESVAGPDEGAVERERVRQTAEALTQLKPSEIQCLLLKALGYSYDEIAARTGFSWTKVNRSLTEGRKRFFAGFTQIESGRRCRRLQPLISAACDGEGSPADRLRLKAHLRTCQGCRAVLRRYRAIPERLAQLLPPIAVLPVAERGGWWSRLYESLASAAADRTAALGYKLQATGEHLSAQKATAVVASTAALAGGAAVHDRALDRSDRGDRSASTERSAKRPAGAARSPEISAPRSVSAPQGPAPPGPTPAAKPSRAAGGSAEFGIEGGPAGRPAARDAPGSSPDGPRISASPSGGHDRGSGEFGPAGGANSAARGGGGQEFAP